MKTHYKEALILVDIQNDFIPGGALPTQNGRQVVPIANKLIDCFDFVVATQDWHPRDHKSFAANHKDKEVGDVIELNGLEQILWPVHCVQDSRGADLVNGLYINQIKKGFKKRA